MQIAYRGSILCYTTPFPFWTPGVTGAARVLQPPRQNIVGDDRRNLITIIMQSHELSESGPFTTLLPELRLMVWYFLLPPPRLLEYAVNQGDNLKAPITLSICSESRKLTLKYFTARKNRYQGNYKYLDFANDMFPILDLLTPEGRPGSVTLLNKPEVMRIERVFVKIDPIEPPLSPRDYSQLKQSICFLSKFKLKEITIAIQEETIIQEIMSEVFYDAFENEHLYREIEVRFIVDSLSLVVMRKYERECVQDWVLGRESASKKARVLYSTALL
ncbi:hypothetical protein BJ875DRAFT_42107 [Amylocarpus encephaloides]|uniref:2EXR domain-containing protein n=1 Tax=Amylocarpus encephaloides TaxID=45428 RepID=A0A9P7YI72_9HELO|nr:hypothetical protein BJ875DRAFT_42107 [Amylocarpus encephaloides]